MPDWAWVALGFSVAYLSLGAYLLQLRRRAQAARRRLEEVL